MTPVTAPGPPDGDTSRGRRLGRRRVAVMRAAGDQDGHQRRHVGAGLFRRAVLDAQGALDGLANDTEQHNAKDDQHPAETGQMVALAVAAVLVDGAAA